MKQGQKIQFTISGPDFQRELEIGPEESLFLGRSRQCQIQINEESISHKHLEIIWKNQEILIKDCGSSNGTFRLPQKAPFLEASWPIQAPNEISLLISNTPVAIKWRTAGVEATQVEGTALMGTSVSKQVSSGAAALKAPMPNKVIQVDAEKPQESRPHFVEGASLKPPQPEEIALPIQVSLHVLCAAIVFFIVSYLYWRHHLGTLLLMPQSDWVSGVAKDVFIGWAQTVFSFKGIFYHALLIVLFLFLSKVMRSLKVVTILSEKLPTWVSSLSIWLGYILIIGSLVWVPTKAAIWGAPLKIWPDLVWLLGTSFDQKGLEKSESYRSRHASFVGSSFYYKKLFEHNQRRVLQDCDGKVDASWDSKKVCLILLTAAGIESLDQAKPVFFSDVGARATLILSIDGLIRVITVEGPQAPSIPFFLASLDVVGLGRERKDIVTIIESNAASKEDLLKPLRSLKSLLENRSVSRQKELGTPPFLNLTVKSSVELGI